MIAFARPETTDYNVPPAWHAGLLAILPQIHQQLRFAFRKLPPDERAEAIAECIANITAEYAKLHERGKADVAFVSTLGDFAIRHYYAGRRTGCELNINDVSSPYCQRQRRFVLKSLDQRSPNGEWKETVVEDRRSTPADVAASRIDLEDWFGQLPRFKRDIAETLATGESTSATARRFQVTPGRVSQLRREFEENWMEFQGEPFACA
jgi:hypothetical protein